MHQILTGWGRDKMKMVAILDKKNISKLILLNKKVLFDWNVTEVFSCDQATLRTLLSVRLSIRPTVYHTFFSQCSSHRIIMKFSGVTTIDINDVHAKGQDQRSKVKVTEVKKNAPIWAFPDCNSNLKSQMATKWSLQRHRGSALLFFEVSCQISRSNGLINRRFWPEPSVSWL